MPPHFCILGIGQKSITIRKIISGRHYRTIWPTAAGSVRVIDQSRLPFEFSTIDLDTLDDAAQAIRTMVVRGAPLIGATAAYGMALALRSSASNEQLDAAERTLRATRPTAHNLAWALTRMRGALMEVAPSERADAAFREAALICEADVEQCRAIGLHGFEIIRRLANTPGRVVNILTHCNAGWLACVDWGTALSPIYTAHDAGIPVHVWVDETRPRNQGAALTAFELAAHGVPHTVIADNLGGHLMQQGRVDMVIVGSDRITATTELTHITGRTSSGSLETVRVVPEGSPALNLAFDVTPARLVTGLITESGLCSASRAGLQSLYPNR